MDRGTWDKEKGCEWGGLRRWMSCLLKWGELSSKSGEIELSRCEFYVGQVVLG